MAQEPPADARAREMTDEERFALLIGVMGSHRRFPSDAVISRGYRAPSRYPRALAFSRYARSCGNGRLC
jgi:hypothetical protein